VNNVEIRLTAIDEASGTVAAASKRISSSLDEVSDSQTRVAQATKETIAPIEQSTASMRSFTTGISGVATASFSLYGAVDRVNESEISLDRSNLMVKQSTKSVEDAERSLSDAVAKHGADSDEASRASDSLSIAQDRLTLANERAQQAQENVSKSIMSAALQVIPTSITMVDSLSKAWNNFPDVSGLLTKISTRVADVGISAKTAAIGVAAFMGGFLIADTLLSAIPEDMRKIAGALTASIAAIVAATIAWMAFNGTMTIGVAVPIILAAVGVGIAGVKAAVAMSEGGVVKGPMVALVGEAGPEIVMPLSRYENQRNEPSKTQTENPQQIITVDVGGLHFYGDIADSKFLEKAAEFTADKISDAVNLRR
jgi:hypothetical protein